MYPNQGFSSIRVIQEPRLQHSRRTISHQKDAVCTKKERDAATAENDAFSSRCLRFSCQKIMRFLAIGIRSKSPRGERAKTRITRRRRYTAREGERMRYRQSAAAKLSAVLLTVRSPSCVARRQIRARRGQAPRICTKRRTFESDSVYQVSTFKWHFVSRVDFDFRDQPLI